VVCDSLLVTYKHEVKGHWTSRAVDFSPAVVGGAEGWLVVRLALSTPPSMAQMPLAYSQENTGAGI
jgi:hypothetical protein